MGMKFIDASNKERFYQEPFSVVSVSSFPVLDIIQQRDLNKCKFADIPFESIFTLRVNVKKVGAIVFLFDRDSFNKEELVNGISPLGELPSNTVEDAINKTRSLYEIASRFNPLASLYYPFGDCVLIPECFETLINNVKVLYVEDFDEELLNTKNKKNKIVKEYEPEERAEPKPKGEKEKVKLDNPIKELKKDGYHFLFAFVAAFLIGFTTSIAIFDIYLGKMIYIFFFICALIGMVLNGFIYYDSIKKNKVLSTHFLLTAGFSLIGLGASIGGYFLFKNLAKDKPAENPNILIIIGAIIGLLLLSTLCAFLYRLIKKSKNKRA